VASLSTIYRKALVTGGAGFIGSHLIERLLGDGLKVVSVDNYSAGKAENLDAFRGDPDFQEADCDVTDYDSLKKLFPGVDVVFHEAASKKTICLRDPRRDLEVNAKGAFNLLKLCRDFGVKKYVHASTGSVYGEALYYPQDERHPLSPTSYYGVSKLAGDLSHARDGRN
jgi:UDP-glucose 4-epimerase